MTDEDTPWNAEAALVKLPMASGAEPQLVFEGTLRGAVHYLCDIGRGETTRYRLSLPNRCFQPRSFQGRALTDLVALAPRAPRAPRLKARPLRK